MTRLLVSVRDLAEARTALEAGVDLIDLKEPDRGGLGRVDAQVARDVAELLTGRAPLSMALGELTDDALKAEIPATVRYVKVGLADCARRPTWRTELRRFAAALPPTTGFVAVVYADAELCAAPPASDVVAAAVECEAQAVLVDTAVKDGRDLLQWWSAERVREFVAAVHQEGMLSVVGGGLTVETIPQVAACRPDYVAVRGAACEGPRTGRVSAARIATVRRLLAQG